MNSKAKKLAERDEETVIASGVPYTIIRAGLLQNTPGGTQGFDFEEGSAARGKLSKEDAAFVCVEALDAIPQKGLIFEVGWQIFSLKFFCFSYRIMSDVANGEEKVSDWKEWFAAMLQKAGQSS